MLIIVGVIVITLLVVLMIFIPPRFGKLKEFRDSNGTIIEEAISEKTFLEVDDSKLGMFLMAENKKKPVLLFLGGGPGIPEYFLESEYPTGLDKEFVVCYLEYRGTSLSYHAGMDVNDMTSERYIEDVVVVTNYLRERFHQEKIYLMGHSFGTFIGLKTVTKYPELYHAYIAMSQISNQRESEEMAYFYMKNQYKQLENEKMVKKFEQYSDLISEEEYKRYTASLLRDTAMHDLGVGTMHNMKSVMKDIFFKSLRCSAYSAMERINIWRAKSFMNDAPVRRDSLQFNAFDEVPAIKVPIYFFAGKYDYTCCYDLQKEYYEKVNAPIKAFYTFEDSAHSPLFEEPEKAIDILKEDIIKA